MKNYDLSASCEYPREPANLANDRDHPRYKEYQNYAAAMRRQLVNVPSFKQWLNY